MANKDEARSILEQLDADIRSNFIANFNKLEDDSKRQVAMDRLINIYGKGVTPTIEAVPQNEPQSIPFDAQKTPEALMAAMFQKVPAVQQMQNMISSYRKPALDNLSPVGMAAGNMAGGAVGSAVGSALGKGAELGIKNMENQLIENHPFAKLLLDKKNELDLDANQQVLDVGFSFIAPLAIQGALSGAGKILFPGKLVTAWKDKAVSQLFGYKKRLRDLGVTINGDTIFNELQAIRDKHIRDPKMKAQFDRLFINPLMQKGKAIAANVRPDKIDIGQIIERSELVNQQYNKLLKSGAGESGFFKSAYGEARNLYSKVIKMKAEEHGVEGLVTSMGEVSKRMKLLNMFGGQQTASVARSFADATLFGSLGFIADRALHGGKGGAIGGAAGGATGALLSRAEPFPSNLLYNVIESPQGKMVGKGMGVGSSELAKKIFEEFVLAGKRREQ